MKIGTKLAICFVALAVLPLGAASLAYLRATSKFGTEMADRGKDILAERIYRDLRRASEFGAVTIEQTRGQIAREVTFLTRDIASRLAADDTDAAKFEATGFIVEGDAAAQTAHNGATSIDLQQFSVHIAPDASRDQIAGTLNRLSGFNEVARTVYLRNRGTIDIMTVTFESGLTISYPGRAADINSDPRENDWYLKTLESTTAAWFNSPTNVPGRLSIASPVQTANGQLIGVARLTIRADALLTHALDVTRLPPEAKAYLFGVPKDDPVLMPHEVASFNPKDGFWKIVEPPLPISLDGDDAWLKVISDIRSGVPGLESVQVNGVREAWAFGPIGATVETDYHIAISFPANIIDTAQQRAAKIVEESYRGQLRAAIAFTLVAGLIAAALAIFGARNLTSPIRRLHEAAAKLAKGDFTARIETNSRDEIGDLGRDFNKMVPALEEQLRIKRDLHTAREIQQHLIPKTAPAIDGFDIAGETIYCDETGGDYQDYVPIDSTRYAVVIGDVTGHGVSAALLMSAARSVLRANAPHEKTASGLLAAVNRQLSADSTGGRSLTLFYMQLRSRSRKIDWISAGHEPAMIYAPRKDKFTLLNGEDIPLGVDAEWAFHGHSTTLPDDGLLVAYTDGVREARNEGGKPYGLDRLQTAIRKNHFRGSAAVLEAIRADVAEFRGNAAATDDLSILVIKPA